MFLLMLNIVLNILTAFYLKKFRILESLVVSQPEDLPLSTKVKIKEIE